MAKDKITKEQVENIAELARLNLRSRETSKMQKELAGILDFIDQLDEVDVSSISDVSLNLSNGNVWREDEAKPEEKEVIDAMMAQAPNRVGEHIKTKPIL